MLNDSSSYNDWFDYALSSLGFSEVEAAEYARKRVVECENRARLREQPTFKDAA